MNLGLENSVSKNQVIGNNNVNDLITDLKNYLENDFEDNVCSILGISRYDRDIKYSEMEGGI